MDGSRFLGIDLFIDDKTQRFEDIVKDVDVVLDFIGGDFTARSYTVLKPGGRYVTALGMQIDQEEPTKRGITSRGLASEARGDLLEKIAGMLDAGHVKVFINRKFPLEQAQEALDFRLTSKNPGKVVLTVIYPSASQFRSIILK